MASFGTFIKQEREKQGWTQTDLGAKVGINAGAISKIEHGKKQLSVAKLVILAELFRMDIIKIKELYFGDKFAKEAYENGCPETVFTVAEEGVKYLQSKNVKQGKLNF